VADQILPAEAGSDRRDGAGTRLLAAAGRRLAEARFTKAGLWVLADNHP
jgi:hypothetical protein